MQRFQNILVFIENHERDKAAVARAVSLATRNEARLAFISVVHDIEGPARFFRRSGEDIDVRQLSEAEALERLEGIREESVANVKDAEIVVCSGVPFLEIVRDVICNKRDLVIMTAEEEAAHGMRGLFFGSTSMHLMRKCPCPVWVLNSIAHDTFDGVLAAVDPNPMYTKKRTAINRTILELASSLARIENASLHIVHAWDVFGEATLRGAKVRFSENEIGEWAREVSGGHRLALNRLIESVDTTDLDTHVHFVRGDEGVLIPQISQEEKIDAIVMGTVSRTGLGGFLMGNSAERILRQVECSVMTCKPADFKTPVAPEG